MNIQPKKVLPLLLTRLGLCCAALAIVLSSGCSYVPLLNKAMPMGSSAKQERLVKQRMENDPFPSPKDVGL